jgi:prolyl-tRNA editing enzyme YbaK/EbsC (Cys-tRNA(Pro) deacylase)
MVEQREGQSNMPSKDDIEYERKIKQFIIDNKVDAKHIKFDQSCHTVEDAARAVGTTPDNFVKNICLIDNQGNLIIAIVKGEDRVSTTRVGKELGIEKPRMATPEEILERTGYPRGGTPSFGYSATFLIDPRVMEKDIVYSGGGSENSLIQARPAILREANGGNVVRIRN